MKEVQVAHVPATLPQETGDHNPELIWGWRAENKERNHGEFLEEEVIREVTSATGLYTYILKTRSSTRHGEG